MGKIMNSSCRGKSRSKCNKLKKCKYVSSNKRNYCRKSKNKNKSHKKIKLCVEDNYKLIKECKNIKNISLDNYIKIKSLDVQITINDDSKLYNEYRTKKFKNYVKKNLRKYVSNIGKISNNYYDYSPGEIAKMIYEDYHSSEN